jgi:hypothetical protein
MYATELNKGLQILRRGLVIATVLFGCAAANGDEPEETDGASQSLKSLEQPAVRTDEDLQIAEAIRNGTVLEGMTTDQVLSARGAPLRKEVIPPDAELWHYAEGEVAFSRGRTTYIDLDVVPARPALAILGPEEQITREVPEPPPSEPRGGSDTARVNTPGDGFLALRSEPTIRRGRRLLKIPHGTRLTLGGCTNRQTDGRWCSTTFEGQKGWVFERYLVR